MTSSRFYSLLLAGSLTISASAYGAAARKPQPLEENPTGLSEPRRLGPVDAVFYVEAAAQADDNVTLRTDGKDRDLASILRPGLEAKRAFGGSSRFDARYQAELLRFRDETRFNANNHSLDASLILGPERFQTEADVSYLRSNDRTLSLPDRVKREETDASLKVGGSGEEAGAWISGEFFQRLYDEQLDRLEHRRAALAPRLEKQAGESSHWVLDGRMERYNYPLDGGRNGWAWQARGGLRWGSEEAAGVSILAGVRRRTYDGPAFAGFEGGVAELNVRSPRDGRLTWEALAAAEAPDSVTEPGSGFYRERRARLAAAWRATPRLTLTVAPSWARQRYGDQTARVGFTGTRIDKVAAGLLRADFRLAPKTVFFASSSAVKRSSSVPDESYNQTVWTLGARQEF